MTLPVISLAVPPLHGSAPFVQVQTIDWMDGRGCVDWIQKATPFNNNNKSLIIIAVLCMGNMPVT